MTYEEVMKELKRLANPNKKDLEGMARFGINVENAWVISMPNLRILARKIGKNHELALEVWESGVHEARILAGFIDNPEKVTEEQMEKWVKDFDSWDVCDGVCSNLFDKTTFAYEKALEWSGREEEFVKRAGFVTMAALAIHDKGAKDEQFYSFLKAIKMEASDERNFVKKAVNWALRQIGKSRNKKLYDRALKIAYEIEKIDSKSARWIARDAIRELQSDYIKRKFS